MILSKKLTGLQGYFNIKQKCDKQNFSLKIRIRSGENYNMIWWSILFVIKPNVLMSSINIQIRGFADETYIQLLFVYNSYKQNVILPLFCTKFVCYQKILWKNQEFWRYMVSLSLFIMPSICAYINRKRNEWEYISIIYSHHINVNYNPVKWPL